MNKKVLFLAALCAASFPAVAGGYLTNTNQNVAFLRQPAHNAVIGIEGAYYNPAGIGFMNNGWHLALDIQNVTQRRYTETTFGPFAYGINNNGKSVKQYIGTTDVPVLPHLDLAFVHDRWFGSFHFGVVAGGGKCDYADGLGSFEAPIAMLPALINTMAGSTVVSAYDADINLVGKQYYFAGQFNIGYKLMENLSVSAGLRMNYVITDYNGAIRNIQLQYGGQMLPAANVLGGLISTMSGGTIDQTSAATMASGLVGDKELDCSQSDMGYTPVLSAHYRTGKFDFAARYEFKTRLRLKNDTETNSTGISQFDDGKSIAADIPAMLALGVQYSIIPSLRFNVGGNFYFDKQSSQYNSATGKNDKQDYIKNNPWEFMAGLEYDINKIFTVSGGVNTTTFSFGKSANYISDMSFTTNSCSVGLGGRIHINDRMSFDLAIFRTFYSHLTKSSADYAGVGATYYKNLSPMAALMPALAANLTEDKLKTPGSDNFYRKSFVMGIGFNIDF